MAGTSRGDDEYLSNYVFDVQLGPVLNFSFSKITNIASELEYQVIGDGGNNDKMQFFEKPHRKPDTIIFERGLKKGAIDELLFVVEGLIVNNIMIQVKKGKSTERIFTIEQGMVTKISYTDLDASKGEILVKKMEMQHTGIIEMPL